MKIDISKDSVEVFEWRRHGLMNSEQAAVFVRKQAKLPPFKPESRLNQSYPPAGKTILDAGWDIAACAPGDQT